MKILFIIVPAYDPEKGGVQRIVEKLSSYFYKTGNEVSCFSFEHLDHKLPEFGESVFVEKSGNVHNTENTAKLIAYTESWNPDIVLNEMPYENKIEKALNECENRRDFKLIGCLNNSLYSVKNNLDQYATTVFPLSVVKLLHNKLGNSLLLGFHRLKHRRQLKRIINQHDAFVLPTGSEKNINELRYFVGRFKLNKVHCISNSIPDFEYDNSIKKENRILHVGRLNDGQKRSDLLLKVWEKVALRLPNWEFDIVGDGPYMQNLKNDIEKNSITRVNLMGFQQPDLYYKRSRVFMMTSAFEGFPSVLLEAQSNGVIPVAFDSYPAINWILNNERDAVLVPAYHINAFSQSIINLAKNQLQLSELAKNGIDNAKKYTVSIVGAEWIKLFKRLK